MKLNSIFLILLIFSFCDAFSQNTMGTASQGVDFGAYPFGTIDSFDKRSKDIVGTPYLFDYYKSVQVVTSFDDTIVFNEARYNLMSSILEFKEEDYNKFLSSKYIKKLNFYLPQENCMCDNYQILDVSGPGFNKGLFKVLHQENDLIIADRQYAIIVESNYNQALDIGTTEDQIKVRSELYLIQGTKVLDLEVNKRKFSKYFSKPKQVKRLIKKYDYSYTEVDDLLKILDKFDLNS